MSLHTARPGLIGSESNGFFERPKLTVKKVYEAARAQVPLEPGLIHGSLHDGTGGREPLSTDSVCAVGAILKQFRAARELFFTTDASEAAIEELQRYNDSMPDVPPEVRKERVIGFLDAKIAALAKVAP